MNTYEGEAGMVSFVGKTVLTIKALYKSASVTRSSVVNKLQPAVLSTSRDSRNSLSATGKSNRKARLRASFLLQYRYSF